MVQFRPALRELTEYVPGVVAVSKLSSNENPLGPSPLAMQAAQSALAAVHRYPDGSALRLRERIADHCGVESAQVIVGNGSDELMALAAASVIEAGSSGICARHTFSVYAFVVLLMGGEMEFAPMEGATCEPEAFVSSLRADTRILFVCNPNNPTGGYLSAARLRQLLQQLPSSLLVVVDEAYADFADAPDFASAIPMVAEFDNLLVLRTFSKLYGLAGLRIGYGIGCASLIATLQRVRPPFNVNAVAQAAAIAALQDSDFVRRSLNLVHEQRGYLQQALNGLGLQALPSQANFICVRVTDSDDTTGGSISNSSTGNSSTSSGDRIAARIAQQGVATRPLRSFGLPDWLRVSVGRPEENRRLIAILAAILEQSRSHSTR